MKNLTLLLAAALTSLASFSQGFSYEYEGVSLKYTVTDKYAKTAAVRGLTDPEGLSLNGGYMDIPAKVFWYDEWYDVTAIQKNAFEGISALRVVTMPNSLTTIGEAAFKGCSIGDIVIPNSIFIIGKESFKDNPITDVVLEEGPSFINMERNSFDFENITCAYLGRQHEDYIGQKMTNLATLTLGNSITEVYESEFAGLTKLKDLTFGSSVLSIGKAAFEGCPLNVTMYLSPALEVIGDRAFANTGVQDIYMGPALKKIGNSAFEGCSLKSINISAEWPPIVGDNAFSDYSWNLHVQGKLDEYQSAPGWKDAQSIGKMTSSILSMSYIGEEVLTGDPGNKFNLDADIKTAPLTRHLFFKTTDPDIATVNTDGVVTLQKGIADPDAECEIICETIDADVPVVKVKVSGNKFAGVDEIPFDATEQAGIDYSAPYAVYSLDGRLAGKSIDGLAKGIYVIRQGNNTKKFIAR